MAAREDTIACAPRAAIARPTDPDAELIALCAEFDRIERQDHQIYRNGTTRQEEAECDRLTEALRARQEPLFERILAIRATTLAGVRAKAATLVLWDCEALEPMGDYWNDLLAASLLGDLLGIDANDPEAARAACDGMIAGTFEIGATAAKPLSVGGAA